MTRMHHPFFAILVGMSLSACDAASTLPGTSLGTFAVTGALTSNTCGSGLGAADPWTFDTKLSRDGSTLYWQQDEGAVLSGILDAANKTTIVVTTTAQPDGGTTVCTMTRTDTMAITLNATTAPTATSGTISLSFAVSASSDCAPQLSANGGSYQTLPCAVGYTFTASKK